MASNSCTSKRARPCAPTLVETTQFAGTAFMMDVTVAPDAHDPRPEALSQSTIPNLVWRHRRTFRTTLYSLKINEMSQHHSFVVSSVRSAMSQSTLAFYVRNMKCFLSASKSPPTKWDRHGQAAAKQIYIDIAVFNRAFF